MHEIRGFSRVMFGKSGGCRRQDCTAELTSAFHCDNTRYYRSPFCQNAITAVGRRLSFSSESHIVSALQRTPPDASRAIFLAVKPKSFANTASSARKNWQPLHTLAFRSAGKFL